MFTLGALPWKPDSLGSLFTREAIDYHYGKHHAGYVDKLNTAVRGTPLERKTLEELILSQKGKVFNLAAQIWNHTFYWNCMTPSPTLPAGSFRDLLIGNFGSLDNLRAQFFGVAVEHFGSGWVWLVQKPDGKLAIYSLPDADNPMTQRHIPLLTCDVWEHAYYVDYRNNRNSYVEKWWKFVNWDFVASNVRYTFFMQTT